MNKIKVPKYSLAEELINSISHGIGACFAITALVLCVVKAKSAPSIVACSLYGSILIILYIISCIYHALSPRIVGKKVLRVIDHCNVMLMVAGTYMPICLSLFYGTFGWILFSIVWIITIIGIIFNIIDVDKYTYISVICNLLLGWGILLIYPKLVSSCGITGVIFLISGGALYSIGALLYVIGSKIKYMHSIFHFFVIAASFMHFFFIYFYCI